jgi:hypothetical protein
MLWFSRDRAATNGRFARGRYVYDRHSYADEDKRIMAAVARHIQSIVEGKATSNVVALR